MARVNIGRNRLTDEELLKVLQAICRTFNRNVNVLRGEIINPRKIIPPEDGYHGNIPAVDFEIEGMTDETAYLKIKRRYESIFSSSYKYQVVWYGLLTGAKNAAICITRSDQTSFGKVKFYIGGNNWENVGKYWFDGEYHILLGRDSYFTSMKSAVW